MIFKLYNQIFEYLIQKISKQSGKDFYIYKLVLVCFLLSIFFAFPPYHVIFLNLYNEYWLPINAQISDPFHPIVHELSSHSAKRGFRLTMPLLAHYLGFKTWGCIIIQSLFGLFSIALVYKLFDRIFNDKISSTFLALSFIFIYVGFGAFYDLRGMFDTIAIGLILIAIYYKNPFILFVCILLSAFTDERGLIASSLIFAYYSFKIEDDKKINFTLFAVNYQKISILSAWFFYFLFRYLLTVNYGFYTTTAGANFNLLLDQINNFPLAYFSALEGFWVLVFVGFSYLFIQKKYFLLFILIINTLVILIVGSCVADLTRSVMYLFPIVFIMAQIVAKNENLYIVRKNAFLSLFISFAFPSYYFYGEIFTRWCFPLPFRIIHILNNYYFGQ